MYNITNKPWGREILLELNDNYAMKRLEINKGGRLSLQYHKIKHETWYVENGQGIYDFDDKSGEISTGDTIHIPPKTIHSVEALSDKLIILEASTPELDDIVRLKDLYGRA